MPVAALHPASMECLKEVRKELGLDENGLKQAIESIGSWLEQQPHLPDKEDERILETWLIRCKNSIEKTKETLDKYYTLRTNHSDIMCEWDPSEPWFKATCEYGYILASPELTPELDRVILVGYYPKELKEDYDVIHSIKLMLMFTEIRLVEDYNLRDVYIMDMKNFTFDHVKHITFTVIKRIETCFLSGYKTRLRAIHFINTPRYAEVLVTALKSVLKSKLVSRVHVHGTDLSELRKLVPPTLLPAELGGSCANLKQLWDVWIAKMTEYKSYYKRREEMKSDETKRIIRKYGDMETFGVQGSFRTLNLD